MRTSQFPFCESNGYKGSVITAEPFSVDWVVKVIAHMGGSCTIRDVRERIRMAKASRSRTIEAFEKAFNEGMIECHYINAGKRGRPRYEFRVSES